MNFLCNLFVLFVFVILFVLFSKKQISKVPKSNVEASKDFSDNLQTHIIFPLVHTHIRNNSRVLFFVGISSLILALTKPYWSVFLINFDFHAVNTDQLSRNIIENNLLHIGTSCTPEVWMFIGFLMVIILWMQGHMSHVEFSSRLALYITIQKDDDAVSTMFLDWIGDLRENCSDIAGVLSVKKTVREVWEGEHSEKLDVIAKRFKKSPPEHIMNEKFNCTTCSYKKAIGYSFFGIVGLWTAILISI